MAQILVIDDEPRVRFLLRRLLEASGHTVSEASNGADVVATMPDNTDLVITDIVMPEVDGLELLLAFKKQMPNMPIIAISGGGRVSGQVYTDTARVMGADKIFVKPFDNDELVDSVNALLNGGTPAAA